MLFTDNLDDSNAEPQLAACRDQPGLLPHTQHNAGTHEFWGFDEQSRYQANLTTQPKDWPYRHYHLPITYNINSLGYRAPEFDSVDWANATVIFGCSFVFGDGLAESETISAQIARLTNQPCINLGAGGSGIGWNLHNQLLLSTHYPTPRAVFCLWPDISRDHTYARVDHVYRSGPWNMSPNSSADVWNQGTNPATQAWMNRQLAQLIWRDRCEFVDATLLHSTHRATGCDLLASDWGKWTSTARDGVHPGPEVSKQLAHSMASQLCREAVCKEKI